MGVMHTGGSGLIMPGPGYRSITVPGDTYARILASYMSRRDELRSRSIRSISAYLSYLLQDAGRGYLRMRPISVHDPILIRDEDMNRTAELVHRKGRLYCHLCSTDDCVHAGYAYSLPGVYPI